MPLTTLDHVGHHGMPVHEVVLLADTGLPLDEAQRRLAELGPNTLPPPRGKGWVLQLLAQVNNPLNYVLLGAALLTVVILGLAVVNVAVGLLSGSATPPRLRRSCPRAKPDCVHRTRRSGSTSCRSPRSASTWPRRTPAASH